jgi:histidyl-tRNA synthetase
VSNHPLSLIHIHFVIFVLFVVNYLLLCAFARDRFMSDRIQPRTLKGFRDYLPQAMLARERIIDTARRVFRSYGFAPIDTPALEYLEILLGKGGAETDKQLYRFQDHGGRDVGLRFDLTVPLARFAAQHINELGTPFKRYHIAPVWRGENTQRGRYREFMQCDFDTIGTTSVASDVETILVVNDLLSELQVGEFQIRLNHRGILSGFIQNLQLDATSADILRVIDKLDKIGAEAVAEELARLPRMTSNGIRIFQKVLSFAISDVNNDEILRDLDHHVAGSEVGGSGVARLREVLIALNGALPSAALKRIRIEPSIARGLDYYTGIVLETKLNDLPEIGSICSGGRYDNLAELYTNQQLPGIGASLGLDRLLAAIEELKLIEPQQTPAQVFIPYFDPTHLAEYFRIASDLRTAGLSVEVYPEPAKLSKQLQYADRKGFRVAIIAGQREFAAAQCQIKDLKTTQSTAVPLADNATAVIAAIQQILSY